MANYNDYLFVRSHLGKNIFQRDKIHHAGLPHILVVKGAHHLFLGSNPPEVRSHIAIVRAVFIVDFSVLQLASIFGVALAQDFFRRKRNNAIHDAGAVLEDDVQAIDDI